MADQTQPSDDRRPGGGRAPFDLHGRVAVVTGGNGGIGFGIAAALGQAGADVAVWARDEAKTEQALGRLADRGATAFGIRCDVTDEGDVERATAATVARFGRLDICVANAGGGSKATPFLELSLDAWERGLAVNLTGAFLCFRATARQMAAAGEGGALVGVSSIASRHAQPGMAFYAAAKAGLHGLVRTVAAELAPIGIRCNALVPGFTENARLQAANVPTDYETEVTSSIPVGRWGVPEDLGTAAVYLADPTLAYQTGGELVVDGAYSIVPPYLAVRAARPRILGER